jgi:hypothetical protein
MPDEEMWSPEFKPQFHQKKKKKYKEKGNNM